MKFLFFKLLFYVNNDVFICLVLFLSSLLMTQCLEYWGIWSVKNPLGTILVW